MESLLVQRPQSFGSTQPEEKTSPRQQVAVGLRGTGCPGIDHLPLLYQDRRHHTQMSLDTLAIAKQSEFSLSPTTTTFKNEMLITSAV